MKKIKILLTYDYELPLGSAKDYDRALFQPAEKLLTLANELNVPVVLFADICSAIKFKLWDYDRYYLPFKNQLQTALKNGHDVQLHIHPHWMNSTFKEATFKPSKNFSLSSFKNEVDGYSIEQIIGEAFREMTTILKEVNPDYKCIAFRAGGYDVEPESKRILNKLFDLGIRVESSVIQNFFLDYSFSQIDYSKAPDLPHWFISKDGPLTTEISTDLLELPISSKPVGINEVVSRRVNKIFNSEKYKSRVYNNSGKGFVAISGSQSLKSKYRSATNPMVLTFDREYREVSDLESIVSHNVRKYSRENVDLYLTAIAHPKSMGDYHLSLMKKFVENMRSTYGSQVEFITYREVQTDFGL